MNLDFWMTVFRWLSYIGLLLVFISTVGTSILQSSTDKLKDNKIDTLVSGNKELLLRNDELVLKINQYQHDLKLKDGRIKELEVGAKKAKRNVTSMYDFNGAKRETSGGRVNLSVGEELEVFQRIVELEKNKNFGKLIEQCEEQIKKTPEWLTPYLFLGVAYANTGDTTKAISNLEHVVNNAPGDPSYAQAEDRLKQIRTL